MDLGDRMRDTTVMRGKAIGRSAISAAGKWGTAVAIAPLLLTAPSANAISVHSASASVVVNGPEAAVTVAPGEEATFRFSGKRGQRVSFLVRTSDVVSTPGYPDPAILAELVNARSRQIVETFQGSYAAAADRGFGSTLDLSDAGTYLIRLSFRGGGDFEGTAILKVRRS